MLIIEVILTLGLLAQSIFLILKASAIVDWSWWIAGAPVLAGLGVLILFLFYAMFAFVVEQLRQRRRLDAVFAAYRASQQRIMRQVVDQELARNPDGDAHKEDHDGGE